MTASTRAAIRGEQLRLVLEGIGQSFPVAFLLSSLLVIAVDRVAPLGELLAWYVAFLALRVGTVVYARDKLRQLGVPEQGRAIERILMLLKIAEGCCWGALLWIGLSSSEPAISVLLLALMCAICGNAVSLLSPLRDLYLALVLPVLAFAFARLWSLGEMPYRAVALCCILYVAGQYGQARIANARIRKMIALQFENRALVEELQQETGVARAARQGAEEANAAKSRFLAAASHDLRQPIHALGLYIEALAYTRLTTAQRHTVDSAKAAYRASSDMLNTLLDFSRIEAGVIVPQPRPIPLQPMLDRLENELAPMADVRSLVYRSPQNAPWIVSDPTLLELILRNLIHNAIRYTERGGLLIGCRRRKDIVSIDIYDTGIGIPTEQQAAIFREFHQLGNPERDRQKGLGLGLAISRGLATALGHDLTLVSIPGRGSVFRLRVPFATQDAGEAIELSRAEPDQADVSGLVVLIVDDDPVVRDGMDHLLRTWGCIPWLAGSMEEATALLRVKGRPDAIICDNRLRGNHDGAQVVRALRYTLDSDVPALLVTGDTAPERLREASRSGMPLLHKPVFPDSLRWHLGRAQRRELRPQPKCRH